MHGAIWRNLTISIIPLIIIEYKITQKIDLDIYKGTEKLWTKSELGFYERN